MAEIKGESSPYIQKRGQVNYMQNITGTAGKVMLSGKMGKILTATPISIVSASVDDMILKEDSLDVVTFPEYVDVLLSTGTTIQFPVESWGLDPDYEGTSIVGTYFHEAIYNVPTYYLGEKPTVFLSVHVKPVLIVSGGILNSYGNYKSRTFLEDGNIVISEVSKSVLIDLLIIAGGGAGGFAQKMYGYSGGGGGAGGVILNPDYSLTTNGKEIGTYPVVIGCGGAKTSSGTMRNSGGNSSFIGLTAIGGGAGGNFYADEYYGDGLSGGSGGGGSGNNAVGGVAGEGTINQGNNGGNGSISSGGGGGGAGGDGGAGYNSNNGGGNAGSSISNNYRTGSNAIYAHGGRGGDYNTYPNTGDLNSGSGGGGGRGNFSEFIWSDGAPGGSGIVVIRYSADYILE